MSNKLIKNPNKKSKHKKELNKTQRIMLLFVCAATLLIDAAFGRMSYQNFLVNFEGEVTTAGKVISVLPYIVFAALVLLVSYKIYKKNPPK